MTEHEKIAVIDNEFEAGLLEEILRDQSIPFLLKSFHDTAYDGLFQSQKGWGAIYAPAAFREVILDTLTALRDAPGPESETEC